MRARSGADTQRAQILSTIDEARFERKRGGSRPLDETQPPAYQVISDARTPATRVPVLTFAGTDPANDLIWIELPDDPKKAPVIAFRDAAADDALFTLTPASGSAVSSKDVIDERGKVVCRVQVKRRPALLRTRWQVTRPDGELLLTFTERISDAFWRRTMRLGATFYDGGAMDLFGLIVGVILYPFFAVKPRCQLMIEDADGRNHGRIFFVATMKRPREDFSVYLPDGRSPESDTVLFPAALAAIQSMR
ncbi:hypothetical protein [Williamsia maris]|uniref:hypothetical protein n=1 Tax=Williamsia maris TaxID=72806 RepID=UPI0020A26C0E|nr:hypothetical protein [Williamsia maris]